jgi:hypothetical protein
LVSHPPSHNTKEHSYVWIFSIWPSFEPAAIIVKSCTLYRSGHVVVKCCRSWQHIVLVSNQKGLNNFTALLM